MFFFELCLLIFLLRLIGKHCAARFFSVSLSAVSLFHHRRRCRCCIVVLENRYGSIQYLIDIALFVCVRQFEQLWNNFWILRAGGGPNRRKENFRAGKRERESEKTLHNSSINQ